MEVIGKRNQIIQICVERPHLASTKTEALTLLVRFAWLDRHHIELWNGVRVHRLRGFRNRPGGIGGRTLKVQYVGLSALGLVPCDRIGVWAQRSGVRNVQRL